MILALIAGLAPSLLVMLSLSGRLTEPLKNGTTGGAGVHHAKYDPNTAALRSRQMNDQG